MAGKRRASAGTTFDNQKAFNNAADYQFSEAVFVTPEFKTYIELKAVQHAVMPEMFLPAFWAATANAMGMAKLQFTATWVVPQNPFFLLVGPKGSGKTPVSKICLAPLVELEQKEKKDFDAKKRGRGKKSKSKKRKSNGNPAQEIDEEVEDDEAVEDDEDDGDMERPAANGNAEPVEAEMFHKMTRIADQITPEALILTLCHGSGVLLLKSDEFKGFFLKYLEKADNISAICSAFTGEEIKYTTVKRGEISIYKSRLSIFGCIQPGPLAELLNSSTDPHGHWDRYIMLAAAEDKSVEFADQLKPVPVEAEIDVLAYLTSVRDNHIEPRSYKVDVDAMNEFIRIKAELNAIDEKANNGNEVSGMTKKAYPNLQKLATIMCCARETMELLSIGQKVEFLVRTADVKAAWEVIQQSMKTFTSFKIALSIELGLTDDTTDQKKEITEDEIIKAGANKIKQMFDKADENNELLVSIFKRDRLFPACVSADLFIKALLKFKIAKMGVRKSENNKSAQLLCLQSEAEDRESERVFKMLFEINRAKGVLFDPTSQYGPN